MSMTLQPDLAQAKRFLTLLDEEADQFSFRTFTDDKTKPKPRPDPLARIHQGTFADLAPRLTALNQRGAGIFVTVNATDGRGGKEENITRVRALWQECDHGNEPLLPVEPHFSVESSPGNRHHYILVEDLPIDLFGPAQQRLVQDYGSDPGAADLPRILRLPGFYHLKDPAKPHLVRLIHESGRQPTPWAELREDLPPVLEAKPAEGKRGDAGDYLAALLEGENVHDNALRLTGQLVRQGVKDEFIRIIFAELAKGVAEARGPERAADLTGDELERMISGAHDKRFGPPAPVDFNAILSAPERPPAAPSSEDKQGPLSAHRWRLVPARELLTDPEPMRWLIKDYLQPETLNLLFGDSLAGKSLIALDWAASLATGLPWREHPTAPAPVIYLAGEGHFGIKRRLFAWALNRGALEELRDAPLVVSSAGASLTDQTSLAMVGAAVDEIVLAQGKPGLIVIDTLARNIGAADENSAADIALFVRAADALRLRYQAAVLVVHHSGHNAKDRARGSSAIRGAVDCEWVLTKDAAGGRTLVPTKTKDSKPPAPLGFVLEEVTLPWLTADGEPETSVVLRPSQYEGESQPRRPAPASLRLAYESLLASLDEAGAPPPDNWQPPDLSGPRPTLVATLENWRAAFLARHSGDNNASKDRIFRRSREQLTRAHAAEVWRDQYWPRPDQAPWPELHGLLTARNLVRRPAINDDPEWTEPPDNRTNPGQ